MNTPFPKTARDSAATLHQASDEALGSASKAIDSTRDYANSALDSAQTKVRGLRDQVDPMVDMLTSKAQSLARQSLDMASEARHRAQQSLNQASVATSRYVAEQPMRSVLIAAAVGAAVALLISAARNRNDIRY
jgi:ElaB/YqjD/DUF883 family membrane-anchored ribosome-binding protein